MNKNIISKILLLIIVILFSTVLVFIVKSIVNNNTLKDEEKQIILLKEVLNNFISGSNKYTIKLDESCKSNLVTRQSYKEDNIKILQQIVEKENSPLAVAKLYISFSKNDSILRIILKKIENGQETIVVTQNYKLYVEEGSIKYDTNIKDIRM